MDLNGLVEKLSGMPDGARSEIVEKAAAFVSGRKFIPSPGPQTDAYFSKADVLLYGGAAGGGKSALINGLALTEHKRSLLMRRRYTDLEGGGGMIDELLRMNGGRDGFNGSPPATLKTADGRMVTFGAAKHPGDEQSYQGRARDLLGVDEAAQFTKAQIQFLMGWVRSADEGQRCRVVLASNPPLDSTGDWMIEMFAPWLDVRHPNPAKPGELRWFITDEDGEDEEVEGPAPIEIDGRLLQPKSRTFIPARLADNPFLASTDYASQLDAMPEPLRSAMRDGNFMLARADSEWQVIPTQWVRDAQARWTADRPEHAPMSAMGVDVAQGGEDKTVIAARYDAWFDELDAVSGRETPTGRDVAGRVIVRRRNGCAVVVDAGGGWGGSTIEHLQETFGDDDLVVKYVGAGASSRRTADQALGFYNKRAETHWRFREALDPAQDGGSQVALPPDPELLADLTAPTYETSTGVIKIEPKEKLVARIGRSPDKGDAVVMCWSSGPKLMTHGNQWRKYAKDQANGGKPAVVSNRAKQRRRR